MKSNRSGAPDTARASRLQLVRCILVLLLGICAGLQLGKIAPVAGFLQAQHGYSLTTIGWLTAFIGVFVALAALPSAKFINRIGPVAGIRAGAIILTAGAAVLAATGGFLPHMTARTVEAVGYVFLVIAAPAYLATSAPPRQRPVMLALWGSFVPVGYAIANVQAAYVEAWFGIEATLTSAALLFGVFSVAVLAFVPAPRPLAVNNQTGGKLGDMTREAGLLASAFGIYVLLSLSFFTFLPVFLDTGTNQNAISPAAIAVCVPLGNIVAAALLIFVSARHTAAIASFCFIFSALFAVYLFQGSTTIFGVASYAAFAFLGGIIASMLFGSVPQAASPRFSAALVVGIIAQAGGIGTIAGPPLAGFVIDTFGWGALTALLTALSVAGALLMIPLVMAGGRQAQRV